MKAYPLASQEAALNDGFNHMFVLTADDLTTTTVSTAQAIVLFPLQVGDIVRSVTTRIKTPFAVTTDTASNSLTVTVGDTGSATRFTASQETNAYAGIVYDDGVTNTDTSLVSATATFVAGDVGKVVTGAGIPAGTTIASRTNGTTVVLSQATTASATGVSFTIVGRTGSALSEISGPASAVTAYAATDNLKATFTPVSGKAVSAFNVGEIHVFVKLFRPVKLTGARANETILNK